MSELEPWMVKSPEELARERLNDLERAKAYPGAPVMTSIKPEDVDQIEFIRSCAVADATFSAHAVMSLLSRIDTQAARIAELEGLVDLYGAAITDVADGAEDEGDRAYFGSTNDLDRLKELREQHFQRRFVSGTALEGKKR